MGDLLEITITVRSKVHSAFHPFVVGKMSTSTGDKLCCVCNGIGVAPTPVDAAGVFYPVAQRISERISRILGQKQSKVAFKPLRTVNSWFPRPKAQEKVDRPQSGTVYEISCTNCSFVYYGQTEGSLKTGITEHKRAVSMFDHDSKISCHVHENNHEMDFGSVRVVGHEANFSWNPGFQ